MREIDDSIKGRRDWTGLVGLLNHKRAPLVLAIALVGGVLGGLLVGYEPVGGDPDRLYRPLKTELARTLAEGRLPFWSSRFGLGIPLVAESHVAAFYPPNLVLYRLFDVSAAYRLSMWLHYVAVVATTYFYGRCLRFSAWGSALAGAAFALCGFQTIHSSHEPFYCVMPYLPLALLFAECYIDCGRRIWLALLAVCLGMQWTLGHFQIQMWTGGLVILTALWRTAFEPRLWLRALAVLAATAWGAALSAVQLGPSWQFAASVHQTYRAAGELIYYSFPPSHWFELVLPQLIRDLQLGPEDPYWFGQQTWGYEAALYVGSGPLIFAFIAALGRPASRSAAIWRILVPLSFLLGTMPRWWPAGYLQLLALPGIGYFRVPARYTLLTSFGLALLAGEGFNTSVTTARFRRGLLIGALFAGGAAFAAYRWTLRPDVHLQALWGPIPGGLVFGMLAWAITLLSVLSWRWRRLPAWAPLLATCVELGILFYLGTTQWGWAVSLPEQSPVLSELRQRSPAGLIGGETENLPVRAGLATAYPYIGFSLPRPNDILKSTQTPFLGVGSMTEVDKRPSPALKHWLERFRVEYLVTSNRSAELVGTELGRWRDRALDLLVHRGPTDPVQRVWSMIKLDEPWPEAHVALRARTVAQADQLIDHLVRDNHPDTGWFLAADAVPPRADGSSAKLVAWHGTAATVEHRGPCDLVIARTFDPGWLARIDDGPEQSVVPVDGGLQAVRLEGSGVHHITLRYSPLRFTLFAAISLTALALVASVCVGESVTRVRAARRSHDRVAVRR
jgi:hypothetical protein